MALSGIHITCATAGIEGADSNKPELPKAAFWSESPASGVATTNAVTSSGGNTGLILRIDAAADSYVSISSSPNASVSPRWFVRAGQTYDFAASSGDKVAWVAA